MMVINDTLAGPRRFADGTKGLCELILCPWVTICPTLALPDIIRKNSYRIHYQILTLYNMPQSCSRVTFLDSTCRIVDPTRLADVHIIWADPLKLINIYIQNECKINTIYISQSLKVMNRHAKNCKNCDPTRSAGPSADPWTTLICPAMGFSDGCVWSIKCHSNLTRDRPTFLTWPMISEKSLTYPSQSPRYLTYDDTDMGIDIYSVLLSIPPWLTM